MSTATATRTPKTFLVRFRPVGRVSRETLYCCAFDEKHALEIARRQLNKRHGEHGYELLTEPAEVQDRDLPHSEGLYDALAKQRAALSLKPKAEQAGSIYIFYTEQNHRYWVHCTSGPDDARAIAEARLPVAQAAEDGEPEAAPPKLRQQFRRMTIADATTFLGGHTALWSVLVPDDAKELVGELRAERRADLIAYHQDALAQLEKPGDEIPVIKAPPRPSRLLIEAESYAAQGQAVDAGILSRADAVGV